MHRPLGRAALVVKSPFSLAVARLHSTLAWPLAYLPAWAGGQAGLGRPALSDSASSHLAHFGRRQNAPEHSCVLNLAKIFFINKEVFLNVGGGKIFKR